MLPLTKKHAFDLVHDSQRVFRLLLDALSHPGKTVSIAPMAGKFGGDYGALLALATTLMDNETAFCICPGGDDSCCEDDGNCCTESADDSGELAGDISLLTLAKPGGCEAADFIFVLCKACLHTAIPTAKSGSLADPHKSATLVVLNDEDSSNTLTFSGPGICGQFHLPVSSTVQLALKLRDERHDEYPEGIDLIFVSRGGELFAIPRLVKGEVL